MEQMLKNPVSRRIRKGFKDPRQGRDSRISERTRTRLKTRAWQMVRASDLEDSLKRKAYALVLEKLQEVIYGRKNLHQLVERSIEEVKLNHQLEIETKTSSK
ncbi:hypothetical protein HYT84_03505 [Candidatus Micrarchaeota archaeon]|nr:hypothetical protein [Candidatus Micrarchaeota archaeon]